MTNFICWYSMFIVSENVYIIRDAKVVFFIRLYHNFNKLIVKSCKNLETNHYLCASLTADSLMSNILWSGSGLVEGLITT
jgi:hypothetical protein